MQASLTALSQAQHGLANLPGAATSLLAQYAGAGPKKPLAHTEEVPGEQPDGLEEEKTGPDPRDVDKIVGEMITLSGRWALYRRFVWNRLNVSIRGNEVVPTVVAEGHKLYCKSSSLTKMKRKRLWRKRSTLLRSQIGKNRCRWMPLTHRKARES